MLAYLRSLFSRSTEEVNNVVGGSDAVFEAILEHSSGGKRYSVVFGEPQLVDRGGQFSQEYMVQVPTSTASGDPEPPDIEYELPDDDTGNEHALYDLLDLYSIEAIADLGELEGETVMGTFQNGTLTLRFDEFEQQDE